MRTNRPHRAGSVLLVTLMVLLALMVLGLFTIFLSGLDNEVAVAGRAGDQALYAAEAGVNWGLGYLKANPNAAAAGYCTQSFAGQPGCFNPGPDPTIEDAAGTAMIFPGGVNGAGQRAAFGLKLGPDPDQKGQTVSCDRVGDSDSIGRARVMVSARGYGPGISQRVIEAHIALAPQMGLCPAGQNIAGGYPGG